MPKSRKLRVSGPAKIDLKRIGDYTRGEWGAAQKRKYLGRIKDTFRTLRDTPGMGAPRDDIDKGLRAHPTQKHIIFYRETKTEVVIVRVLHESMEPGGHLGPRPESEGEEQKK